MKNKFFERMKDAFRERSYTPSERWKTKVMGRKKEAMSVSANVAVTREANKIIKATFLESANPSATVFDVILIEEGLGNLGDRFYYSKEALKSAAPLFEGKKIFADHPSRSEDDDRPERSVRDVIGHFENVTYLEANGRGQLKAKAHVLSSKAFDWARELMHQAVAYAGKYPDKNFIGLSINAGGDSEVLPIDRIYESTSVPAEARIKIEKAKSEGIDTIRLVTKIDHAVSCDLVTEPGAGGRVTSVLTTGE